jgi:isocitrate dehydrogenase
VEAFFAWLLQNIAWDTLKKAIPKVKQRDLVIFRQALEDAQNRIAELQQDREMLHRLVQQRNRAFAELIEARRRIKELERELRKARKG